ncbi:MAG: EAL domain-containing protein, partial [Oscillospiraceae bacterium]|nr:EAL domain-containing protein [Oscillospiraceae bacterium]
YSEAMREKMLREQELTEDMEPALQSGQFEVWFQPQFDYQNGKMSGAEALVRWNHPKRGLISPGEFISLFEKNGRIYELDKYVWEASCRQVSAWRDKNYAPLTVSVNVSRIDLYDPQLVDHLVSLVQSYALAPERLHLEITESAYMDNPEQLIDVVCRLHDAGFVVEMDDFGSGYSSLNTLKDVPVDVLKLDVKFLSASISDARSSSILGSVIRMASAIDLRVIAEGVEDVMHAQLLHELGCRFMQGYYFSKPLRPAEMEKMLENATANEAPVR